VLDAIEAGRQQLSLPPLVALVPVLRFLPVPVFDAVADALGVNRSMDAFTGRTAPGTRRVAAEGSSEGAPGSADCR
jgi:all-trans-retinol dehydrogenase (NAD+)